MDTPEQIGGYTLLAELGRGGSATVCEATDPRGRSALALQVQGECAALGFHELALHARVVLGGAGALSDNAWHDTRAEATRNMCTSIALGALEMDARRRSRASDPNARERWSALLARAEELGYYPGVVEAEGWLAY